MEKKLNDEEYFQVELMVPEYGKSEIVSYRKDSVKFESDYALVRAFSKDPKYANYVWRGVIDRNFHTVAEFCLYREVKLLPHNDLLQFTNDATYSSKIEEGKIVSVDVFGKTLKMVNDNLLIAQIMNEKDQVSMYDIQQRKFISNRFTEIGDFQEVDGKRIALAKRRLRGTEGRYFCYPLDVMCYIDDSGHICSEVYNPLSQEYVPVGKESFETYVEYLELLVPTYQTEEEITTNLKRTLIRKNTTTNNTN